jgi:hypothetical protein
LLKFEDVDAFRRAGAMRPELISKAILENVKKLDEREQIEPWLRDILFQPYSTAHTPAEIADILTTTVKVNGRPRLMAFVNKGKSCKRVTARDVAHQFLRAASVPKLSVIVFLATGDIQDEALRDLVQVAAKSGCDYLVVNRLDVARIFMAYGKICANDGLTLEEGRCACGYAFDDEAVFHRFVPRSADETADLKVAISEGRIVQGQFITTGDVVMPVVPCHVFLPRFHSTTFVDFLVDTAADTTMLGLRDALRMGIRHEKLQELVRVVGVGGSMQGYRESAILSFLQADKVLAVYQCNIFVPELRQDPLVDASLLHIPSVVGQDVLKHLATYIDHDRGKLYLIPKAVDLLRDATDETCD